MCRKFLKYVYALYSVTFFLECGIMNRFDFSRKGKKVMDNHGFFENMMDSAVLLDKAGRIISWNAGAAALFGYSKKEVVGWSINFVYDRNYPFPKLIQELNQ